MPRIIAGATLNQTPLDWTGNAENIKNAVLEARNAGVRILGLPELCITGYGCEDLFLSEWLPAKALSQLLQLVEICQDITVTMGLPLRHKGRLYNCTCVIRDREVLGFTAKQSLALDGVHYEPRWFEPWPQNKIVQINIAGKQIPLGDVTYEVEGFNLGIEICEDAWRGIKRPASRLYERGINLILNPSASHFAFGKTRLRENLVIGSSSEFKCVYLYTNLLGNEAGRMIFDGEILIASHGQLLGRNEILSFEDWRLVSVDLDSASPMIPYDFDKKKEFTRAVSLGLFDYLRKSKAKGFVLSLSGGADSSACAVLVTQMVWAGIEQLGLESFLTKIGLPNLREKMPNDEPLGLEKFLVGELLHCVYQSSQNSSGETLESAKELCASLGAKFSCWNIDGEVESSVLKLEKVLGRELDWDKDDVALQNIQARVRSPHIWMLANLKGSLLVATSNRSEGDTGYATMDGDTSGSISPIAGVDKQFVREWLVWAELELGFSSLTKVNKLTPSAELRPQASQQTDETDLMPYDILVEIERLAIRDHLSPIETYSELLKRGTDDAPELKRQVAKFFTLWSRSQWKRERLAPAFHLDDFNIDPKTWCRFPILSAGFKEELEELEKL